MQELLQPGNLKVAMRTRPCGFSLVELMVAMVLGLFLISAVVLTFLSARAAATDAERLSRIQENVRIVSEYLVRDIRNAGFHDEGALTVWRNGLLRSEFAEIENDGGSLRVRYAGRGHCAQRFDEIVVVENRYFLDGGDLVCEGRRIRADKDLGQDGKPSWAFLEGQEDAVIISGLVDLEFEKIEPADSANCEFILEDEQGRYEDSCLGVRMIMTFEGLQGGPDPTIELTAAFRNVVLERINSVARPPPNNTQ